MDKKYKLVKILCIFAVIITIFLSILALYQNLISYHNDSILVYHSQISVTANPEIKNASFFTNQDIDIYKIRGLLVYYKYYEDNILTLELANTHALDIYLIKLRNEDETIIYDISEENVLYQTNGELIYIELQLEDIDDEFVENLNEIYIDYMYDDKEIKSAQVIPFPLENREIVKSSVIGTDNNIEDFDFIKLDNNNIIFIGDEIIINEPIFIPKGYTLFIRNGQRINFVNNSFLVSYSPVCFQGEKSEEIVVYSSDNTGMGVFVCQSDEQSTLSYTRFEELSAPKSGIWELTGSITFYESDVIIKNCVFSNNKCEDGLNIVRSEFNISDSVFEKTFADAFDSDFSNGKITNCTFSNTGNDALDISTSNVKVEKVDFIDIGDKAISAGEKSVLYFSDIDISKAIIGIASKDMSYIYGEKINISNTMIGMTLYQKKPEFGPGLIDISEVSFSGEISIDYLIQTDSTMIVDGHELLPRSETKESILFDKMINGEPLQ